MKNSRSQCGQDVNVLNFYKQKENGFFVEIGAMDGIRLSNTYLLEMDYNWKGICVEPVPFNYEKLIKNRLNSFCSNKAVYSVSREYIEFDISNELDYHSGISSHLGRHKQRVDKDKTTIKVETITLNDLLKESNAPSYIDYLSIDTEGSEYEILKVVDFNYFKFGIIDIEVNGEEPKRSLIRELLTSSGYEFHSSNVLDDTYILNRYKK